METLVMFLLTGPLIQGVFCGFSINLPQSVEAVQGSCVFIPCTFDIDQQHKSHLTDAKRMWFKQGQSTPVFASSSPDTGLFKGEIFGTATQKNCSTRFDNVNQSHTGLYYFRIDGSGNLKFNYKKVQITVSGSPPKPTLILFKDQQKVKKMEEVMEGSSVSLSCSTKIFCPFRPPSLTWSSSLNESITEQQYQNQSELISDLNLTVSHRHHRVTFNCSSTHQLQQNITTQRSRMIQVLYAPKNTSVRINPAALVLEGGSVTLICSSDANPAVNYTWYRDTEDLLTPVQTGPNMTIINTDPTHRGRYYCRAENRHGSQNTSVLLDVQYAPKNTSLSEFLSNSVMEGKPVTLTCRTDANPAELNYTWYKDTGSQFEFLQTGYNHTYTVTNPTYGAWYGCKAQNQHGQSNATIQLDVQFAPKISSSCSRNGERSCVCEAHGNPRPTLEWRLSGRVLTNSTETPFNEERIGSTRVKSVLTIHQILSDTVLQCFSSNIYGSASQQQLQPVLPTQETSFHFPSMLLGAAVSTLMTLCVVKLYYERRRKETPSETRRDDTSGLILTQIAAAVDNDGQFVHTNNSMLSSTTPSAPESLHYSSIDFTNTELPSGEIRGISSLTGEYATVRHRPAEDAENNTEPKEQDMTAEVTDTSSPASEDVIYENMGHHHRQKKPLLSADDAEKRD